MHKKVSAILNQQNYSYLISIAMFIVGLITLLMCLTKHQPNNVLAIIGIDHQTSLYFNFLSGFIMMFLSIQLIWQRQLAWKITEIFLFFLVLTSLIHHRILISLLYLTIFVILLIDKRHYSSKQKIFSQKYIATIIMTMSVGAIAYGILGMTLIEKSHLFQNTDIFSKIAIVLENIFLIYTPDQSINLSKQFVFLLNTLNICGLFIIVLAFISLFKPAKYILHDRSIEVEKARTILKKYSNSTEDYIKLWPPDKHYYFNHQNDAFLSYKVSNGVALVLDSAVGNDDQINNLFKDFTDFCLKNSWMPSIVHANDTISNWVNQNYNKFYIGSEAIVELETFCKATVHDKHFRYVKNKTEKDGVTFQFWHHPIDETKMKELSIVSDNWLSFNKRREYCFAMGYFDREYLEKCDIGVAIKDDHVIAFTNLLPTYTSQHQSIDMMRYMPKSSPMIMHYLLMKLLQYLYQSDNVTCNLGLSPLSNLSQQPNSANTKILKLVKKIGKKYYSFGGLEQFKNKFQPRWSDRYIYYYGFPTALLPVAIGLGKAMSFSKELSPSQERMSKIDHI